MHADPMAGRIFLLAVLASLAIAGSLAPQSGRAPETPADAQSAWVFALAALALSQVISKPKTLRR